MELQGGLCVLFGTAVARQYGSGDWEGPGCRPTSNTVASQEGPHYPRLWPQYVRVWLEKKSCFLCHSAHTVPLWTTWGSLAKAGLGLVGHGGI